MKYSAAAFLAEIRCTIRDVDNFCEILHSQKPRKLGVSELISLICQIYDFVVLTGLDGVLITRLIAAADGASGRWTVWQATEIEE